MRKLDPRVPESGHPLVANAPILNRSFTPPLDHLLASWDHELTRAARAWRLGYDATQDLVQAGRIALARALKARVNRPIPYLRRVIANAMRDEYRARRLIDNPAGRSMGDGFERTDVIDPAPLPSESFFDADKVRTWIVTLPPRLQVLFDLLYVQGLTQRSVATTMGISKTRVVQLNAELLLYAKAELVGLAA